MQETSNTKQIGLRYHLDNNKPVDLMTFTKGLQALHDEYIHYIQRTEGARAKAGLNIYKVEEGSIIFELIEALPVAAVSDALGLFEGASTILQFGQYFLQVIKALTKGEDIPEEGSNCRSLSNIATFIEPLASNPNSNLTVSIVERVGGDVTVYNNCTLGMNSTEGNALQNRAESAKEHISQEVLKTEEAKNKVLLRLVQINKEQVTQQDRGIIEDFSEKKRKLLFEDESIKMKLMQGSENPFKYLHLVDAIAMYHGGKIVAYRITALRDSFDPEDE